jgi:hypothetical protein
VRADADAEYTQVGALLEEARRAGAKRLAIATRQGTVHRVREHGGSQAGFHAQVPEERTPAPEGGR